LLSEILSGLPPLPVPVPELLVGREASDDAAVYRLNDQQALIASVDFFMPIVDDPYDFGRIAATNALSDVYAMGGRPILALALVAMPVAQIGVAAVGRVMAGGEAVCHAAGIPVAGGHSIDSLEPMYGLVVLGLAHPERIKRNDRARAGDLLILGKPLGVGILGAALKKGALDAGGYAQLIDTATRLNTPGVALAEMPEVHALTDVTGFGLLGHVLEVCRGSGLSAELDWSALPLLPAAERAVQGGYVTGASERNWQSYGAAVTLPAGTPDWQRHLLTDPQTAGGLLVACTPGAASRIVEQMRAEGFERATVIGRLLPADGTRARVTVR
jgi:selenide,water dikinase